jgi:tetratricopeptide (TPR) repeat protein
MAHAGHSGSRWEAARAVRALRRAVGATHPQDANWARYAGNLANALRQRQESGHGRGDPREAIRLYRQTCARGMETATAVAFYAARDWAAWAVSRQGWPEAASAYESGVQAMERVLRVQIARHDQETWLRVTQALPAQAGYAYARSGDLQTAAVVIERSRAVLWTLALEDLDRMGRPDLAERYRRAAASLAPLARS